MITVIKAALLAYAALCVGFNLIAQIVQRTMRPVVPLPIQIGDTLAVTSFAVYLVYLFLKEIVR